MPSKDQKFISPSDDADAAVQALSKVIEGWKPPAPGKDFFGVTRPFKRFEFSAIALVRAPGDNKFETLFSIEQFRGRVLEEIVLLDSVSPADLEVIKVCFKPLENWALHGTHRFLRPRHGLTTKPTLITTTEPAQAFRASLAMAIGTSLEDVPEFAGRDEELVSAVDAWLAKYELSLIACFGPNVWCPPSYPAIVRCRRSAAPMAYHYVLSVGGENFDPLKDGGPVTSVNAWYFVVPRR